jgi:hypothetical protein
MQYKMPPLRAADKWRERYESQRNNEGKSGICDLEHEFTQCRANDDG